MTLRCSAHCATTNANLQTRKPMMREKKTEKDNGVVCDTKLQTKYVEEIVKLKQDQTIRRKRFSLKLVQAQNKLKSDNRIEN